ncbi:MAG: hypothetical protein AAFU64_19635 [Bacteroidota bacterium]
MNRGDVTGMEQNNNALKSVAQESIEKLGKTPSFNNDPSLKNAALQMVRFYKLESQNTFPTLIDFYLKKESFEKIQKSFESKRERERTQADVDKFNKAANAYNKSAQTFNKTNEAANKQRSKSLDAWNKAVDAFFSRHSN